MTNIILKSIGEDKVQIIRIVREMTGLGLAEAKKNIEKVSNEEGVKIYNIPVEKANNFLDKFIEAGAEAILETDSNKYADYIQMEYKEKLNINIYTSNDIESGFGKKEVLKPENYQQTNIVKLNQVDIDKFQKMSANDKLFAYLKTLKDIHVLEEKQSRAIQYLHNKIESCDRTIGMKHKAVIQMERRPGIGDAFASLGLEYLLRWAFGSYVAMTFLILFIGLMRDLKIRTISIVFCPGIVFMLVVVSFVLKYYHIQNIKSYNRHVDEINKKNEQILFDNVTLDGKKEHAIKLKKLYWLEIKKIKSDLSSTRILLNQMYSRNIIYPKYRNNLIYICSIYEYFESKRCTSLDGPYGAYNLLENDIKFGAVVDKLDIIINKLDSIIENQKVLYDAILECNASISNLDRSISGLANTIEVSNAKLENKLQGIAFNTEMTSRYAYLSAQCELYRTLRYY